MAAGEAWGALILTHTGPTCEVWSVASRVFSCARRCGAGRARYLLGTRTQKRDLVLDRGSRQPTRGRTPVPAGRIGVAGRPARLLTALPKDAIIAAHDAVRGHHHRLSRVQHNPGCEPHIMNWFRNLPEYRQRYYALLTGAILLTLPCYCTGLLFLILATAQPTHTLPFLTPTPPSAASATLPLAALTLTAFLSSTRALSPTLASSPGATETLIPTRVATAMPTAAQPPLASNTPPASETPVATITPSDTATPTSTRSPTGTPEPTETPTPTPSLTSTATGAASPTSTLAPAPSLTPTITLSPTPSLTPTITSTLTVTGTPTVSLMLNSDLPWTSQGSQGQQEREAT